MAALIGGFFLLLLLALLIYRNNLQKKKANQLLTFQKNEISEKNEELHQLVEEVTTQKDEISRQKSHIELIHDEMTQSINYAKRIQYSLLPDEKLLNQKLDSHFVFYRPKETVSGDFYWWAHIENHTIIAAADCTGHGVPGAFMSLSGISFLREIVMKEYITHPAVILRKLRKEVIQSLKQKGIEDSEQAKGISLKDGMDMALISINHENNTLQFAGANNPL